jgi:glycine/D-amino acid oxidase-like deaminating enzyme/nitrite reductase/ring-hydroxylating ferredoxin subunit
MIEGSESSKLPQFPEPYWRSSVSLPTFPKLTADIDAEVAIVGGGITGLTSAYLLAKAGVKVAVIDAGNILNGTTGHTTAKITAQHGLIYDELINTLGFEAAKLYYQANSEALQFMRNLVKEENIDCELTNQDAYVYTNSDEYTSQLQNEYQAYEKLGIESDYTTSIEMPFKIKSAIIMKNQAQFHPLKYLLHLTNKITELGGKIFELTTAIDIENGNEPKVLTKNGFSISCRQMIIASHFPFEDKLGFYFARMYASRSYVIAAKTQKEFPGGMYINAEKPTRSLRYTNINGEQLVLFIGENHRTGIGESMIQHYEALEAFAEETFGVKEILYRWSTQDLKTLDKVPYIGRLTENNQNIFVATGFRGWGMTHGTVASLLITDLILGNSNRYEEIYSPQRFHADPDIKKFISYNADVAKHLIKGKLEISSVDPDYLTPDEGSVVMINGQRAGAYKDTEGQLHIVDTTCTHMGCELVWNTGERSWDCPCHGSRFSYLGDVLEGPAEKPLKKIK